MTRAVILVVLLTGFMSCEEDNPLPGYLYIADIQYNIDTAVQGTDIHEIPEIWIYVNDNFHAAVSPGSVVPLLPGEEITISLLPGIRINGISSAPEPYFGLMSETYLVDLQAGETDTLIPLFSYSTLANFLLVEDFENDLLITEDIDGNQTTNLMRSQAMVFKGQWSGRMSLTAENGLLEVATPQTYTGLPETGAPVYVELHYKNEVDLSIGLIGIDSLSDPEPEKRYWVGLRPSDEWNKAYLDISEAVRFLDKEYYGLLLGAVYNPQGEEQQDIFLDNIKFLY